MNIYKLAYSALFCSMWVFFINSIIHQVSAQNLPITPIPNGQICWDRSIVSEPQQSFEEFIEEVQESSGIYTNFRPVSKAELIGYSTYQVPANETVNLLFQIYSPETVPQLIRYIVLVNEKQIAPFADEPETLYFDVLLEEKTMNTFSISLAPLSEDIYDIILLSIPSPDTPLEPDGIINSSNTRLTLIAGEGIDSTASLNSLAHEVLPSTEMSDTNVHNLTLTLTGSETPWTFPEPFYALPVETNLLFDVLVGYIPTAVPENSDLEQPETYQFALLFFVNFEQVSYASDKWVLHGAVARGTAYSRIPVSLDVPQELTMQEVMVVKIDNPRVPRCVLSGPEDSYFFNQSLYYNRAAFQIVP